MWAPEPVWTIWRVSCPWGEQNNERLLCCPGCKQPGHYTHKLSQLYEIQKCLKEKISDLRHAFGFLTAGLPWRQYRMCLQLPSRMGRYLDQMIGDKTRRLTLRSDASSEILRRNSKSRSHAWSRESRFLIEVAVGRALSVSLGYVNFSQSILCCKSISHLAQNDIGSNLHPV